MIKVHRKISQYCFKGLFYFCRKIFAVYLIALNEYLLIHNFMLGEN